MDWNLQVQVLFETGRGLRIQQLVICSDVVETRLTRKRVKENVHLITTTTSTTPGERQSDFRVNEAIKSEVETEKEKKEGNGGKWWIRTPLTSMERWRTGAASRQPSIRSVIIRNLFYFFYFSLALPFYFFFFFFFFFFFASHRLLARPHRC